MLEKDVERKCGEIAKRRGCLWYKWSSPSMRGVPDRLMILPGGETVYIELKSTFGTTTKLQDAFIRQLTRHGSKVYVVNSTDQFEGILDALKVPA